ncbi:hypothetical protein KKF91_14895, partial [Myxococcota bacterium]|nr:hypothetical protein [Myxococcota bacterium]
MRDKFTGSRQETRLDEILKASRTLNRVALQAGDPRALIARACQVLVEARGYHTAWIALTQGERVVSLAEANCGAPFERFTQLLQRGAWPGCQQEALSAADGIASRIAGGVCG